MDKIYFTVIDIDKIQNYIFQTGKLKEIRGGSAILADLNDFDEVNNRVKTFEGNLIYAGGGTIKAYFNDNDNDDNKALDNAQNFILNEIKFLRKKTKTATLTGIIEETTEKEFQNDFRKLNVRAERKLRKHKESKHFNSHLLNNPFIKFCDSCRIYPATSRNTDSILCETCLEKRHQSNRSRLFGNFKRWIEEELKKGPLSEWDSSKIDTYNNDMMMKYKDISDIGDKSRGYIGLIYCDGNRMGQRLGDIGNTPDEYESFSKLIKESVENTLFKIVAEEIKPDATDYVPVEFILIGGDDLIIIVPANKSIRIAQKFCKEFHEETQSKGKEVSMSAGVVIAHSKFPIYRLYNVAEGLLKSAKKLSNNLKSNTIEASCIDFTVISTPSTSPIESIRSREYVCKAPDDKYHLYRSPYSVYDFKSSNDELQNLIDAIRELKDCGFPKTKLNQFYQVLFSKEKDQILFDSWLLRSRLSKVYREKFDEIMRDKLKLSCFPWCEIIENGRTVYKTPISDIVELYDFIDRD